MVKILGVVDVLAGLALFSILGGVDHKESFILIIVFLLLKSSLAFFDIGGILDLTTVGLIFLSFFFVLPSILLLVVGVLILIKGIISIFS